MNYNGQYGGVFLKAQTRSGAFKFLSKITSEKNRQYGGDVCEMEQLYNSETFCKKFENIFPQSLWYTVQLLKIRIIFENGKSKQTNWFFQKYVHN